MAETQITKEQVKEFLSKMSVLELLELTKELEDLWGVKASSSAVVAGSGIPHVHAEAEVPKEEAEEKTEFDVILKEYPQDKKIGIIKEIRAILNLGLKEAKELVEGAPKTIKEAIPKEEAEKIKKQIEDAGGVVEIK